MAGMPSAPAFGFSGAKNVDYDNAKGQMVVHGQNNLNDDDVLAPIAPAPGPITPAMCKAQGQGLNGGPAGVPTSFHVIAHDKDGRRIYDGGATIKARITPAASVEGSPEPIDGLVRDLGDGTYMVTYNVPSKGDYSVAVSVTRTPIGGSPFPVHFDKAPEMPAPSALPGGMVPGMPGMPGAGLQGLAGSSVNPAQVAMLANLAAAQAQRAAAGHPAIGGAGPTASLQLPNLGQPVTPPPAMPSAGMIVPGMTGSAPAMMPGMLGMSPVEELSRTLHVGNVSPLLDPEQLKILFGHFGTVTEVRQAGDSMQYAFIEFATSDQALTALAANGMVVGDRALKVEIAKTARLNKPALPNLDPMHQLRMLQMQQQTALLQQQVVAGRAAAASGTGGLTAEQLAQKRIAEINSRFGGGGAATGAKNDDDKPRERSRERRRSRSRSRDRDRRDRRRSRSRDRRRRSRSRDRRRSRSRDARKRASSRDRRRRSRSRDRRPRRSSRSKSRDRRDRGKSSKHRKRDRRSRSRSRSGSPKKERKDRGAKGETKADEADAKGEGEGGADEKGEDAAKDDGETTAGPDAGEGGKAEAMAEDAEVKAEEAEAKPEGGAGEH